MSNINSIRKKHIVVIGNGLDAWFSAASLSKVLNKNDYSITILSENSNQQLTQLEFGESTLPDPKPLHITSWMHEDKLIANSNASLSFGIALSGWNQRNATYFHPFSSIGAKLGTVAFHHLAMKLRSEGTHVRLSNYTLASLAAQANRLELPSAKTQSVLSTCDWAMHINTLHLAQDKRNSAIKSGVKQINSSVQSIVYNEDDSIDVLLLSNGDHLEADLFIDASGSESKIRSRSQNNNWLDWKEYFPFNHYISTKVNSSLLTPYSHAQAHKGGWLRHITLQDSIFRINRFNTDVMNQNEAHDLLRASANDKTINNINSGHLRYGRLDKSWQKNYIAIGSTAYNIDPIGVSNLQLLRSSLSRLINLLPADSNNNLLAKEYNRQTSLELDNARDFAFMHYKLNGRNGEAIWDQCRLKELPETLQYKLDLYQARGLIALQDEEPVSEQSWINLFDEHGIEARNYNPLANGFESNTIKQHLNQIRTIMLDAVATMPLHADYLAAIKNNFRQIT